MSIFDTSAILDAGIREFYETLNERSTNVIHDITNSIGLGRPAIRYRLVEQTRFNAYAFQDDNSFNIEVTNAVPLLSLMLFSALLSDETLFPEFEQGGLIVSDYGIPAIHNPANFNDRRDWQIRLNKRRSGVAIWLADFAATFVVYHELGHIVGGHAQGVRELDGKDKLSELVSEETIEDESLLRRRCWEWDADQIAASLLVRFGEPFISASDSTRECNPLRITGDKIAERTLGYFAAGLFITFCYLSQGRLQPDSHRMHPSPVARANHIRACLGKALQSDIAFDTDFFHAFAEEKLASLMESCERLGVTASTDMTAGLDKMVSQEADELSGEARQFRALARAWAWIDWQ